MKPCLFVFCSVQRESLLQRWKRQVQRHGSVLGIRHEERCLPGVSGKCRLLVLIDFSSFLLLNYCRIHIHTCRVGKLFLPLWCVHACHGASWTPKRSCSAFYPSERHADSCFLSLSDNEEQRKGYADFTKRDWQKFPSINTMFTFFWRQLVFQILLFFFLRLLSRLEGRPLVDAWVSFCTVIRLMGVAR